MKEFLFLQTLIFAYSGKICTIFILRARSWGQIRSPYGGHDFIRTVYFRIRTVFKISRTRTVGTRFWLRMIWPMKSDFKVNQGHQRQNESRIRIIILRSNIWKCQVGEIFDFWRKFHFLTGIWPCPSNYLSLINTKKLTSIKTCFQTVNNDYLMFILKTKGRVIR